jgi:hypothetical protein
MTRIILALAVATLAFLPYSLRAAELESPLGVTRGPAARPVCGPCGCLGVAQVRHRSLETTYGLGFDPRNYDQTEPYYYLGPIRSYPRFYVEGAPFPVTCY